MAVGAPVESAQAAGCAGIQLSYKQQRLAVIAFPIQGLSITRMKYLLPRLSLSPTESEPGT